MIWKCNQGGKRVKGIEMEKKKFDQNKYIQKYVKDHYVHIHLTCKPEVKKILVNKAKEAGMSLAQYLIKKGLE